MARGLSDAQQVPPQALSQLSHVEASLLSAQDHSSGRQLLDATFRDQNGDGPLQGAGLPADGCESVTLCPRASIAEQRGDCQEPILERRLLALRARARRIADRHFENEFATSARLRDD